MLRQTLLVFSCCLLACNAVLVKEVEHCEREGESCQTPASDCSAHGCYRKHQTAHALAKTPRERLVRDLLEDYDANVDPGIIKLKLDVNLICASHDKETNIVTSNVWELHTWQDKRLKWTPSEYGGLDSVRIPAKLLWLPDTTQYNSLSARNDRNDVNAVLKSDGSILWIPQATYRTPCTAGSNGQITCPWRIGSWTYDGNHMILESGADPLDVSNYQDNCPLVVASHTAEVVSHTYPCCEEPYPSLDISIVFKPRQA